MVGNNEDAWGLDPWIRFVPGLNGDHGVAYVGHRDGLTQGGMNDAGLVCDGLVVPAKAMEPRAGRTPVSNTFAFMDRILRECTTVREVQQLLARYDWTNLRTAMIVFVDASGQYLVMEGDTVLTGNEATYAVGNFRPSQCTDLSAVPIPRYQQGRAYLTAHGDTSLAACTATMAAMKACRKKLGEGTLYTSIYDLERGLIHLYFYHDFTHLRTFDLRAELARGPHTLWMTSLFPPNSEYERLTHFRTPFNSAVLRWTVLAVGVVMMLLGLFVAAAGIRALFSKGRRKKPLLFWAALLLTCVLAALLVAVLLTQQGIYYFGLSDAATHLPIPGLAWLPAALVLLIVGLFISVRRAQQHQPLPWPLGIGATAVLLLTGLCTYWGLLVP